jgi:hypothetical protein
MLHEDQFILLLLTHVRNTETGRCHFAVNVLIIVLLKKLLVLHTIFTRVIFALLANFLIKNGCAKIMRGIFGRRCSTGDFQVRSGNRYPIHKLEMNGM